MKTLHCLIKTPSQSGVDTEPSLLLLKNANFLKNLIRGAFEKSISQKVEKVQKANQRHKVKSPQFKMWTFLDKGWGGDFFPQMLI